MRRALFLLAVLLVASLQGQYQPEEPVDATQFTVREDLATAGNLTDAQRVLRFVQVTDAHIVDDDAPPPLRQEALDGTQEDIDGGQRLHEEYSDEILNSAIQVINDIHAEDALDFVLNTGDNIDNQLENELMRFIDNWEGTLTTIGPVSGQTCDEDGQSADVQDASQDVTDNCTHLPAAVSGDNVALAPGLPWYSAFGNHDGLYQGNTPQEPSYQEMADQAGRRFIDQEEYVDMHFEFGKCVAGQPGGDDADDNGHGFGYARDRLCDDDPDNDGYYEFTVRGVTFLVLDTLNDDWANANPNLAGLFVPQQQLGYDTIGGYADGAIDPDQWDWLKERLAARASSPVIVAAHHTVNSMFIEKSEDYCNGDQCLDELLAASGYITGPELTAELAKHPNVLAFVGGHTHQHRIQAKTTDDGGFWNIETSALLDYPQEPRIIEIWQAPQGKWFITTQSFTHTHELGAQLASEDPQRNPDAVGSDLDQNVILWADLPSDVQATPQPELARVLRLATTGAPASVGDAYSFEVVATDLLRQEGVDGLNLTVTIGHASDSTFVTAVEDAPLNPMGNGTYRVTFTPVTGTTHFATVTAVDPSQRYDDVTQVVSIPVEGMDNESAQTPGLGVLAVLAILLVARRR